MKTKDICELPIKNMSADDCILFMWSTDQHINDALKVIDAWGFKYKTCAVWDKGKIGMGYYFRQQHELLLVGTKGKPLVPEQENLVSSVLNYPRGQHSKKPDEVRTLIVKLVGDIPRVELFARKKTDGWDVWGNEVESSVKLGSPYNKALQVSETRRDASR